MSEISATDRVLGTPELFTMILVRLPAMDLVLVHQVSREWRGVITTSKFVRGANFLKPIFLVPVVSLTLGVLYYRFVVSGERRPVSNAFTFMAGC